MESSKTNPKTNPKIEIIREGNLYFWKEDGKTTRQAGVTEALKIIPDLAKSDTWRVAKESFYTFYCHSYTFIPTNTDVDNVFEVSNRRKFRLRKVDGKYVLDLTVVTFEELEDRLWIPYDGVVEIDYEGGVAEIYDFRTTGEDPTLKINDKQVARINKPIDAVWYMYPEDAMMKESNTGRGRYDLIEYDFIRAISTDYVLSIDAPVIATLIERLALRLELGAAKYADNNWKNGTADRFHNSLLRHVNQYRLGKDDEDHLGAAACNLMFMFYHTKDVRKADFKISGCGWDAFYRYYKEMDIIGMASEIAVRMVDNVWNF